jgi:large subunit ribosomal protein L9
MKVILLQSVSHVGQKYDTVEVADGYALNYLIPQRLALPEDSNEARNILADKEKIQKEREMEVEQRRSRLSQLDGKSVTLSQPANEQGILFASLDRSTIAQAISETLGTEVRTDEISTNHENIKQVGDHTINLGLTGEPVATLTLTVQAQ